MANGLLLMLVAGAVLPTATSDMVHAQVLFRHGDRMSTHYKSFPTDTVKPVWPYEKGQLTPEGARQESILGQHLNTIYNTLIDTNNVTASQDVTSSVNPNSCPFWAPRVLATPAFASIQANEQSFFDALARNTGVNDSRMFTAFRILDNLFALHPELAQLPAWAAGVGDFPTPYAYTDKTASIMYDVLRTVKESAQPSMGNHDEACASQTRIVFSGRAGMRVGSCTVDGGAHVQHDMNLITLLHLFNANVSRSVNSRYGANLHVQIHTDGDNGYIVKALYSNSFNETATPISIRSCASDPCRLDDFLALAPMMSAKQLTAVCYGEEADEHFTYIVILSIVVGLLIIVLLGTCTALCCVRRQLKQSIKEQQPLLTTNSAARYG